MQSDWHHLIVQPGAKFVPRQLARRFAPILGRTAIDEAQRLRYSGGWLFRDGEAETVALLAEVCEADGVAATAFVTPLPIPPTLVDRIVSAEFDGERLILETPLEQIECSIGDVIALDLGVIGDALGARDQKQQEMHRWAEGALLGLSFRQVRGSLLECGLGRPIPQAHLVIRGRRPFLRIERGTRFPRQTEAGGSQALDNWLHFFDQFKNAIPPDRVLPEVESFWRDGIIEPVLWHRIEERESRLAWLRSWVDHGGGVDQGGGDDPEHREEEGAEEPSADPSDAD